MQRWELAFYIGKAFHQPQDLTEIRANILATAQAGALESDADQRARGLALAAAFSDYKVVKVVPVS